MTRSASPGVIKIDGVTSVAEAMALRDAGATIIGIALSADEDDKAPRIVTEATAKEIRAALTNARLCVTIDSLAKDAATALATIKASSADMIQVPAYGKARGEWRGPIVASGLPLVLDGPDISYEDDPMMIQRRMTEMRDWRPTLVQIRLLDDMEQPWTFLTEEAPKEPREYLQLDEIRHLTETCDTLVTMEVTPAEAKALRASLPAIKGLYFRIGSDGVGPILDLLAALREPG